MASEQTSLRLEKTLFDRLEEMAKRAGVTRTQVIERALEWWVASDGGRFFAASLCPPGFTAAFEAWLLSLDQPVNYVTLVVLDPEGGAPLAFYGWLAKADIQRAREDGLFFLHIKVKGIESDVPVPIQRGLLVSWCVYGDERTRPLLMSMWGMEDGNEFIAARFEVPEIPVTDPGLRRRRR